MTRVTTRSSSGARFGASDGSVYPSSTDSTLGRSLDHGKKTSRRTYLASSEANRKRGSVHINPLLTDEWLDGNHVRYAKAQDANLDILESLYNAVLEVVEKIWRATNTTRLKQTQAALFEGSLAKLQVWGRDVGNGRLAYVLSQSDELRDTILLTLRQLGRLVCNGESTGSCDDLYAYFGEDLVCCDAIELGNADSKALGQQISGLRDLIDHSVLSKPDTRDKGDNIVNSSLDSSAPNCTLHDSRGEREDRKSGSSFRSPSNGSDSSDAESIASIGTSEGGDFFELIAEQTECLMKLNPTSKASLANSAVSPERVAYHTRTSFTVSEPARPWVQNVLDKYKEAPLALVERLGEANWQRWVEIRAQMARVSKIAASVDLKDDGTKPVSPSSTELNAEAVFASIQPLLFSSHPLHDYSPVRGSDSWYSSPLADSVISEKASRSNGTDRETSGLCVPSTPTEVSQGKSFQCKICGHVLCNIRSRLDWKMHVFADLQPYICTFSSCDEALVKFRTRSQWADHEFNQHRIELRWKCIECKKKIESLGKMEQHLRDHHMSILDHPIQMATWAAMSEVNIGQSIEEQTCPLCMRTPGKSRTHFFAHVAQHLEDIALSVLSQDIAAEQEADSDAFSECSKELESTVATEGATSTRDDNGIADCRRSGLCPLAGCGLYFKDLKAHFLTHQAERPEKCPIITCEYHTKGFARKYDQAKHTLTHFKGTLVCPFCPLFNPSHESSFTRVDVLKRHLTSLHGVQQTSSTSRQKSQVGTHSGSSGHSIMKRFGSCSTCPLNFDSPQAFYDHLDVCIFKTLVDVEPGDNNVMKPSSQRGQPILATERDEGKCTPKLSRKSNIIKSQESDSPIARFPSTSEENAVPLPQGWFTAVGNGKTYYYNVHGHSTWIKPTDIAYEESQSSSDVQETNKNSANAIEQTFQEEDSHNRMELTSYSEEERRELYRNTLFPHVQRIADEYQHVLPEEEVSRFVGEIVLKLVNSDFKNRRVEDPRMIIKGQQEHIEIWVKDFFENIIGERSNIVEGNSDDMPGYSNDVLPDHAPWTAEEDTTLLRSHHAGMTWTQISEKLQYRSPQACVNRFREQHMIHSTGMLHNQEDPDQMDIEAARRLTTHQHGQQNIDDAVASRDGHQAHLVDQDFEKRKEITGMPPQVPDDEMRSMSPRQRITNGARNVLESHDYQIQVLNTGLTAKDSKGIRNEDVEEAEIRAILRKHRERTRTGKPSAYRIGGQDVDLNRVTELGKQKAIFADNNSPRRSESRTPSTLECWTPVLSPGTPVATEIVQNEDRDRNYTNGPPLAIPSMASIVCKICGYTLSGQIAYIPEAMSNHIREKHSDVDPLVSAHYLCILESCRFCFLSWEELMSHMEYFHGIRRSRSSSGNLSVQLPNTNRSTNAKLPTSLHATTKTPTFKLCSEGDEYVLNEYDEIGEAKVSPDGELLGGRKYERRTFLIPNKGKLFMLVADCIRFLGYRDSDHLFEENKSLYPKVCTVAEKEDMIRQRILPPSYRARRTLIVTARSMFRQFGHRIVQNGRIGKDDYWVTHAEANGPVLGRTDLLRRIKPGQYGGIQKLAQAEEKLAEPSDENVSATHNIRSDLVQERVNSVPSSGSERPNTVPQSPGKAENETRPNSFSDAFDPFTGLWKAGWSRNSEPPVPSEDRGVGKTAEEGVEEEVTDDNGDESDAGGRRPWQFATFDQRHQQYGVRPVHIGAERLKKKRQRTTVEEATHECGVCGKLFKRSYNWKTHMETHNPQRTYPYPCKSTIGDEPCTKKFQRKTDLERHYDNVHLKARNYQCELCGNRYARRDTLRRHTEDGCPRRFELAMSTPTKLGRQHQWAFDSRAPMQNSQVQLPLAPAPLNSGSDPPEQLMTPPSSTREITMQGLHP